MKRAVRNGYCGDDASQGRASKLALGKCCVPFSTLFRPVAFLPAESHITEEGRVKGARGGTNRAVRQHHRVQLRGPRRPDMLDMGLGNVPAYI